ncbi:hypothetical protein OG884_27880 [Streptosporangium sp. NBC_01755]|uniref:hypothetical protein n=1 Tax=Streptosporangium sp. NBC_01755 TaxID=2975949 RepID=UPI002DDBFA09|nr:hypothetical protein [Streptosporangium sp. NBC_01755]WSC98659.1 hypothetical protein OG884_27880 [Streptosporangium sp. NBC_01755]
MTRLARQVVVVVYEARFPAAPTWEPGPLVLRHGQVHSTTEARGEYYSAKTARVLYGDATHPRRWHAPSHRIVGDAEITGVEALRVTGEPEARGLVAIHLRPRRETPIALLRTLAGRRDAPPADFDPQELVGDQAVIEPGSRPFTVSFVTPARQGLPRLYRQPRYWRWAPALQWLWALASRTSLADYPPDPKNLEPANNEIIRLSSDWHAVVLRDGMGVIGLRTDQGRDDPFFGYAELYLRSIYLDAVLLGMLQKQELTRLEERMAGALDSSLAATMAKLEREVSSFRHRLWAQHMTPHGIPNRLLSAYQRQHALRERFEQLLTEIGDFNRLTRDDENRHVNSAVVVFTLITVPAGIALALLQVLETDEPWLLTTVAVTCVALTALLLRTRSARTALRALRRRFTP